MTNSFPKPLAGRTILDLSLFYPGPSATLMLANFGARVIKVEPVKGDPIRYVFPAAYKHLNRGKEQAALNLTDPEDRALFFAMVEKADAVVEGFRPGVMDKLGIGHDALMKINPQIVMTSISGFGANGPYAHHPAHDMSVLGLAGYFSLPSQIDGEIKRPNIRLADVLSAQTAAFATVMAILEADKTKKGQHVDTSLFDATAAFVLPSLLENPTANEAPENHPLVMADSTMYGCADGKKIAMATLEDKFWLNFVDAAAPEDSPLRDERYATRKGRDSDKQGLTDLLTELFQTRTRDEWVAFLKNVETAVTPIWRGDEFLQDEQQIARRASATVGEDGPRYALYPAVINGVREEPVNPVGKTGRDNEALKKEFVGE